MHRDVWIQCVIADFYSISAAFLSISAIYRIYPFLGRYFTYIQVVESCLLVIVVSPVAERILSQDAVGVYAFSSFVTLTGLPQRSYS